MRDDAGEASGLDLFMDYDKASDFSAIELLRLRNYISDAVNIDADVTRQWPAPPDPRGDRGLRRKSVLIVKRSGPNMLSRWV